jgi:hypothetical protein
MYPRSDIDKARERGETCPVDPELREALNQLAEDLRGEIRSGDAETRRHSGVIGESLRGEIRALAEVIAISNEATQRRFSEEAGRTDRLEGRFLRLEARVANLEDNRRPPRQER